MDPVVVTASSFNELNGPAVLFCGGEGDKISNGYDYLFLFLFMQFVMIMVIFCVLTL